MQATKSKVKAAAPLFNEKVAQKLLSSINWIETGQDYTKIIDEGFYVTNFLFSENNVVYYTSEMCFEGMFLAKAVLPMLNVEYGSHDINFKKTSCFEYTYKYLRVFLCIYIPI